MTRRHENVDDATTQKRNSLCLEEIDGNVVFRAANTNETAAQRIEHRESVVAIQIQLIDEALGCVINGDSDASHSDRCQPNPVANGTLHGVGSQFSGSSDPSSDSRHQVDQEIMSVQLYAPHCLG